MRVRVCRTTWEVRGGNDNVVVGGGGDGDGGGGGDGDGGGGGDGWDYSVKRMKLIS